MSIINKFCVKNSIPLISASVIGFDGQVIFFKNHKFSHLCLNCIYPIINEPDLPRCETVGVIGTAAGFTGLIAAQSVINFLIDKKNTKEKLLMINAKTMKINHIELLNELINAKKKGFESYILYLIQREDCESFKIAKDIDEEYKIAFNNALKNNVNIICYDCKLSNKEIKINKQIIYD